MSHLPVSTTEGGMSLTAGPTDVCFMPTTPVPPPPGIPTPYPNKADHSEAKQTTKKVLVRGKKCLIENSFIKTSTGDEMGSNNPIPNGMRGIKSRKNTFDCKFSQYSGKVKMEGKGVVFHTASTKMNKANTIGKHGTPSQRVVLTAK
jgi:hypothetical protein